MSEGNSGSEENSGDAPAPVLIQIEEPQTADEGFTDPGLVLACTLEAGALRIAASVGGNAASLAAIPAVTGYDAAGGLSVGAGLGDPWTLTSAALHDPGAVDVRGTDFLTCLGLVMREGRRVAMQRTQRIAVRAVFLIPPTVSAEGRQGVLRAADGAGLDLLACIERPVALAHGAALARFGDGAYLVADRDGVACVRVRAARIRLVGWAQCYADLLADGIDGPVRGIVLADGVPVPDAGLAVVARIDGVDGALFGAAFFGEDLGGALAGGAAAGGALG